MKALKLFAVTALCLIGISSCTTNFEEINKNPNKLTYGDIQAYNMLEPLLYGMGGYYQYHAGYWTNNLIQYTCYVSGATRYLATYYALSNGHWQTIWDNYARLASDANHMLQLATTEGKEDPFYEGVALTLKALNLYSLTTIFGDIPYKEAFKFSENLTPAFESQEEVLGEIVADLGKAADIFATAPKTGNGGMDSMYGDSAAKWRKFANSLKMRALCVLTGISDNYWTSIQTMVDDPASYPVFASNADNAKIPFQTVDPYTNQMGPKEVPSMFDAYNLTEKMIALTTIKDADGNDLYQDPRLVIFATQKGGKWTGAVAGCLKQDFNTEMNKKPATMNADVLHRDDMDAFVMDYSEILFILAEGVQLGKLSVAGQTAKSLYEAAVRANIEKWAPYITYNTKYREITSAAVIDYLASDLASYDKAAAGEGLYGSALELILSQKWLSLYWTGGFEPYTHWRRCEYPILTIGDGTDANQYELPTRFGYPNYTVSTNSANVQAALERMGGPNDMHTPLDWSYKKRNGGSRNPHPLANSTNQ